MSKILLVISLLIGVVRAEAITPDQEASEAEAKRWFETKIKRYTEKTDFDNNLAPIVMGEAKPLAQFIAELFEKGYISTEKITSSQLDRSTKHNVDTAGESYTNLHYLRMRHILMAQYPTAWALVMNQAAMVKELKRLAWSERWFACLLTGYEPEWTKLMKEGIENGWIETKSHGYCMKVPEVAGGDVYFVFSRDPRNRHQNYVSKGLGKPEETDISLGLGTEVSCYDCGRSFVSDRDTILQVTKDKDGDGVTGYFVCDRCMMAFLRC